MTLEARLAGPYRHVLHWAAKYRHSTADDLPWYNHLTTNVSSTNGPGAR